MAFTRGLAFFLGHLAAGADVTNARILDATGRPSNAGLLQVKTEFGFGTVWCARGAQGCRGAVVGVDWFVLPLRSGMTHLSASVACKQLGFDFGTVAATPCSSYGGENVCGTAGSTVAMKAPKCAGDEAALQECPWEDPDAECMSHLSDSVVYCSNKASRDYTPEGTLRLVDHIGAPSITGAGRLEVYQDGWASVCSDGWTEGSEEVACRAMGYSGVARSMVGESCRSVDGHDVCGHVAPALSKVACSGSEYGLLGCAHDSKESVFCASEVPKGVLRARLGSALLERTRLLSGLRRTTWCCTALARATRRATRRLRESIGAARVFVSGKTGDGAWQGERRLVWLQSCRFRGRFLIVWSRGSCRSCVMTLSALFCLLPLASALQPQRMTHRKTLDGPTSARSGCGAACLARGRVPAAEAACARRSTRRTA